MDIRFVLINGVKYLRIEDVQEFIYECGSGEETDVRNRLYLAAKNLCKPHEGG